MGPRPALWSWDDLIAEREQYGANEMKPGITGWALKLMSHMTGLVNKAFGSLCYEKELSKYKADYKKRV